MKQHAGKFIDVFKRAIQKASEIETMNEELQKLLFIYHITPNLNVISRISPAELMFARKNRLVFDKLRPRENKMDQIRNTNGKPNSLGEKIYSKNYKFGKAK